MSLDTMLKSWLQDRPDVFEFDEDNYSSLLLAYILLREIGSPNDSLSTYIYIRDSKQKIDKRDLTVSIDDTDTQNVTLTLMHSQSIGLLLSYLNEVMTCCDNKIYIQPQQIAKYLRAKKLIPVLVKPWIIQSIFSEFDVRTMAVNDQLWILRNNDIYLYSKMVANHQVIVQSTHDIVGHIAGIDKAGADYAAEIASDIHQKLHAYFGVRGRGNFPSHLLPFMIGLLLDDLTQPPNFHSEKHVQSIRAFLSAMDELDIDPQSPLVLMGFPARINLILQAIRERKSFSLSFIRGEIKKLLLECRELIVPYSSQLNGIVHA